MILDAPDNGVFIKN
ncbi:TPA: hypothetical protein ACHOXH_005066, partial [Escherichia coli]